MGACGCGLAEVVQSACHSGWPLPATGLSTPAQVCSAVDTPRVLLCEGGTGGSDGPRGPPTAASAKLVRQRLVANGASTLPPVPCGREAPLAGAHSPAACAPLAGKTKKSSAACRAGGGERWVSDKGGQPTASDPATCERERDEVERALPDADSGGNNIAAATTAGRATSALLNVKVYCCRYCTYTSQASASVVVHERRVSPRLFFSFSKSGRGAPGPGVGERCNALWLNLSRGLCDGVRARRDLVPHLVACVGGLVQRCRLCAGLWPGGIVCLVTPHPPQDFYHVFGKGPPLQARDSCGHGMPTRRLICVCL